MLSMLVLVRCTPMSLLLTNLILPILPSLGIMLRGKISPSSLLIFLRSTYISVFWFEYVNTQ